MYTYALKISQYGKSIISETLSEGEEYIYSCAPLMFFKPERSTGDINILFLLINTVDHKVEVDHDGVNLDGYNHVIA